jgi:hypothetical protein
MLARLATSQRGFHMRTTIAFSLVTGLVAGLTACSAGMAAAPGAPAPDGGSPGPGGDAAASPAIDGGVVLPTIIDAGGGPLAPPDHGFQIVSPAVDIDPGVEVTYCFYFKTKNTSELAIQKWASHMTSGSHHMIVYLTPTDLETPGTLSTRDCGFGGGGSGPVWTYSAQSADAQSVLPPDDGAGTPVGQIIKANQSGFIQMHYLNASDNVIHAHVELNAYAYADTVRVTPAAPFVTYNTMINLQPASAGMVNGNCTVSPDAKFYVMTTHTHKQGVHTFVKDGALKVFDSTDWEHPGEQPWNAPPFFSFTSGKLTYQCEYMNPTNRLILTGDSAATDEMCMAIGYFFPAVGGKGHLCIDSNMLY